eukprot:scaffold2499_cov125-Cylindrotheca_fusiformis.AAC.28
MADNNDKDDELKKAKMAAAEISFYLQHDFDDDTCTLGSLQSDLSKMSLKSSNSQLLARKQQPGAYWTLNHNNNNATTTTAAATTTAGEQDSQPEAEETAANLPVRRLTRLSAPQPAEPLDDGGSSRRTSTSSSSGTNTTTTSSTTIPTRGETLSQARKACRRVERLLEGAFDALDPNLAQARIPEESTVSIASLATPQKAIAEATVTEDDDDDDDDEDDGKDEDGKPRRPRPKKTLSIISNASSDGSSTIAAAIPTELARRDEVNRIPDTPGAYAVVQGRTAPALAVNEDDDDVVQEEDSDDDEWNELDRILDVDEEEWNRLDKPNELKAIPVESNLVVAARLASDVEASLQDKVRQSIMAQTPRAAVVHVEHGGTCSSNHSRRRRPELMEDPIAEARRKAELERYKPRNVREKLFGDGKTAMLDIGAAPDDYIRRRDTLPFTVKQNTTTTGKWVASVQTSQKAWENSQRGIHNTMADLEWIRAMKTFSANSEQEAYETGLAMAPPVMESFEENPICCLCKTKFAVFRRPHHCRNCGVVACDWLADNFQKAVLKGDLERAKSLYNTGNVNLRHPYGAWKKGGEEVFNPIHMAILGGNLKLVQWLITEKHCPLRRRDKANSLLCTSKGRSPIRLALTLKNPEILRFLVAEQGLSLMDEDLRGDYRHLLTHLTFLLGTVPNSLLSPPQQQQQQWQNRGVDHDNNNDRDIRRSMSSSKSENSVSIDLDKLNTSLPDFHRAATDEAKSLISKKDEHRRGSF